MLSDITVRSAVVLYYLGFVAWLPFAWVRSSGTSPCLPLRMGSYALLGVTAFTLAATVFYGFFFHPI